MKGSLSWCAITAGVCWVFPVRTRTVRPGIDLMAVMATLLLIPVKVLALPMPALRITALELGLFTAVQVLPAPIR